MNEPTNQKGTCLRPPRIEDAAALARLSTQLGYPATPEQVVTRLKAILDDPTGMLLVADGEAGSLAGFIHVVHQHLIECDPRAEILALVVDEECRGQGIGRALMARAEAWALERGCHTVNLRSKISRAGAHAFYQSLGYEHYKSQKAFRKVLKPQK